MDVEASLSLTVSGRTLVRHDTVTAANNFVGGGGNKTRRSHHPSAERLDTVCSHMQKELRRGVSDFTRALVSSNFPANAR